MVDTIRTLSELNALFPDNTTGEVSPQDIRDLVLSMMVHTEIGRGSVSTQIGTSYIKVPMDTTGVFERGFQADLANDQIAGTPVDMKAKVEVEVQLESLAAGRTVDFAVFVNGVEVPNLTRTFTDDYAPHHLSWGIGVNLSQDDTIDLRAKADQAATDITIAFAILRAQRIGVE